jgi:hypothetical protein
MGEVAGCSSVGISLRDWRVASASIWRIASSRAKRSLTIAVFDSTGWLKRKCAIKACGLARK